MAEDRHFSLGVPIPCRRHYDRFVVVGHPLLESNVKSAIESAASRHLGRRWVSHAFTDLNERASHPCGVLHGEPFSVFAKLDIGANAEEKFQAELSGRLSTAIALRSRATTNVASWRRSTTQLRQHRSRRRGSRCRTVLRTPRLRPPSLIAMRWTALPAQLATTCKRLYRQARQRSRHAAQEQELTQCN
jgi:hypothetical protein